MATNGSQCRVLYTKLRAKIKWKVCIRHLCGATGGLSALPPVTTNNECLRWLLIPIFTRYLRNLRTTKTKKRWKMLHTFCTQYLHNVWRDSVTRPKPFFVIQVEFLILKSVKKLVTISNSQQSPLCINNGKLILLSVAYFSKIKNESFTQVTGFQVDIACLVIFLVCIFYTSVGGMKAVMWTDTFQV